MRSAVVAAITPTYLAQVGSSAVLEAVDEALAQIVAAGAHLGERDQVKALWITAARRRLIDEQRSAESKHRGAGSVDGAARAWTGGACDDISEDGRARWRIREILSVLGGDQRRWAEAWFDEVLSSSRPRGGQPRGLPEALGWTPAKTKSVSRRARMKMARFIEARASGAVCGEQRAHLDAFIMAGRHGCELGDERYAAVLFHLAGCEDCWMAWHARRRELLGRGAPVLVVPFDAVAMAIQTFGAKLAGLATGAHVQATSLLTRAGIGGAATAGGGAATISGKTAAVCLGVVCAAAAGGEVAVVLSPSTVDPVRPTPVRAVPVQHAEPAVVSAVRRVKPEAARTPAPVPAPAGAPTDPAVIKAKVRESLTAPRRTVVRATPGDLPPAGESPAAPAPPPPPAASSPGREPCTPGSLGC